MSRFPILMYHRIRSARTPVPDPAELPWSVSLEAFQAQVDRLARLGKKGVSMAEAHEVLAGGKRVPPEWVVVTFDDGNDSDYVHALPILAARGFCATFFVCGYRVGKSGGLATSMIREMHDAGMHVGSHAMTHRFMTSLTGSEEESELARSTELLEGIVGASVDHFAPPGGRWSRRTAESLRRLSYRAVSTSEFGFNDAAQLKFAYRRIPVVDTTTPERFDAIVSCARTRVASGYLRAASIGIVRSVMGERAYTRVRGYRIRS
jgi:peptidoglycan/xylan/chitin deacetylase (PgdA/CDA1 family)